MITKEELEAKLEPYWAERPIWRHADIGPGWYQLVFDLVDDLAQIWPESKRNSAG